MFKESKAMTFSDRGLDRRNEGSKSRWKYFLRECREISFNKRLLMLLKTANFAVESDEESKPRMNRLVRLKEGDGGLQGKSKR